MRENEKMVETYEINPYTMMIKPAKTSSGTFSEVYEVEDQYLSPNKPFEIVSKSCEYFGSSYSGRRDGTRQLIGITHKAPIIVDPYTSIFLFPTASPSSPQCIWISHDFVVSHKKNGPNSTIVTFRNNETHEIPMSYSSFENQISRTAMLRIKFKQNIKRMESYKKSAIQTLPLEASEKKGAYWPDE
ncbi:MAG TPA: competence protein ComK [Bacillaceae bacterium]